MAMSRGEVKPEENDSVPAGEVRGKRRCVQSACVPCRKRKSKCDGGTPVCATCTAVYKTPCFYDQESENRRGRAAGSKRESSAVSSTSNSDNAEYLISSIRNLPESEVHELIQHIRKDARLDIPGLAEIWRKTVTLPPTAPIEPQSLESELSMLLGKPVMTQSGESRFYGHTSGMSLVPEDENYTRPGRRPSNPEDKPKTWTTVTDDIAFVERLLDLYFRWSHTFYVVFSRECFYKDFRSGREKYCSPLLVNAILAFGCHFTDDPAGRTDPSNFRTAGDHFFEEARRLLFEDETPSLTTIQALCVMSLREPSAGRDSSGFAYMGRCMRMAIELGLHLNSSAAPVMQLTPSEIEVRKVTFWGIFTVDTVWSICVGRISQLPRAAITLDKPILDEPPAGVQPEGYTEPSQVPPGTVTTRMFLQAFSTFSDLLNDNNYMFFAPRERFTSRRLLEVYSKYQDWYRNLPQKLRLDDGPEPQPHIIVLHMLYFTAIVHLFRPMLKVDLIHSDVRPRDACIQAADQVSELLRLYRRLYGLRTCQLVLSHIMLSANLVHLLYSRDSEISYWNLVEGMRALDDMQVCHYFGARGFKIIHALSKVWNLPFPVELRNSKLLPKEHSADLASPSAESRLAPRTTAPIASMVHDDSEYTTAQPNPPPVRRESLSMFAQPERKLTQLASHPESPQNAVLHREPQRHGSNPNVVPPYPPSSSCTPQPISSTHPATSTMASAETLFWTPVPGVGVPILPRNYQMSPMDLDNMLGNVNEWDKFSRDGFKMSETWNQEPVNPYAANNGEGFVQGPGQTNGYNPNPDTAGFPVGDMNQHHHQHQRQQMPKHNHGQGYDPHWWSNHGSTGGLA